MEGLDNIPITYINETGRNDFALVVFTKNEDVNAINTPFVAWLNIKAQTSASFTYPIAASIGAYWEADGCLIRAGPFSATPGTTWTLTCNLRDDSPNLKQDLMAPANPGGTIVVKNIKPRAWSGIPYNFGLYKNGKMLVTQTDVGVGSQAVFQLAPKLYFGVVKDMKVGTVFSTLSITQNFFCVDILDYMNGLIVTLDMNEASGEFFFQADQPYN